MDFPLINACLNGTAAVLLVAGYRCIRRGNEPLHAAFMRSAFLVSALFLAGYLYYHIAVLPLQGGPTPYNGTGIKKSLYLAMLLTHVVLAAVNLPMVLRVFWLAHKEDWERHKRWARWTFPIWLYVSVTGVLVYLVLYRWNPAPPVP
jgi:putative membrane protein